MKKYILRILAATFIAFGIAASTAWADNSSGKKSGLDDSTEATVTRIVAASNSMRQMVLNHGSGLYSDFRVYRSDDGMGIVYEYTFAKKGRWNMSDKESKQFLKNQFTKRSTWPMVKGLLMKGVYYHYRYKQPDGSILRDVKFSKDDI